MAAQTKNKADKVEKGSDTINFSYAAAVEAALEEIEKNQAVVGLTTCRAKKKKAKKEKQTEEAGENVKPRPEVVINQLDQIYDDFITFRESSSPRSMEDPENKNSPRLTSEEGKSPRRQENQDTNIGKTPRKQDNIGTKSNDNNSVGDRDKKKEINETKQKVKETKDRTDQKAKGNDSSDALRNHDNS